ncbi:MAG: hypothetical protein L0Z73_13505 [Gammaproteobacteria bacterium]|nr:hypothetical protein [Gammaproteobacteria bacterium]
METTQLKKMSKQKHKAALQNLEKVLNGQCMSEYRFAEKPFLTQLEALGWEVIDQGELGWGI